MKILTVIQRYFPVIGGSENLTKTFMDYMAKNHKVTIYTTLADDIQSFWYADSKKIQKTPKLEYEIKNYDFLTPTKIKHDSNLDKFPIVSTYPGPFSPNLWKDLILKKPDFDLFFLTAFPYDHILPAYVSSKKWKIPIVTMPLIHQEYPELFLSSLKLSILNNSDAIVSLSNSEKNILIENGIDGEKISIIPPTIMPNEKVITPSKEIRSKFSLGLNDKIVLFIGSKSSMKGIFHLINSMELVWKKYSNVKLFLIGPTNPDFENYFSKLDHVYKKNINDLGIVSEKEKNEILSICDIFVLPSKSESFGLVYIEAWLHSKPVIGCKINSVVEVIDHKINGLLTEFGNVQDLGDAISNLIDNPELCKKYGEEGNKKTFKFTSPNNIKKFENLCLDLVQDVNN